MSSQSLEDVAVAKLVQHAINCGVARDFTLHRTDVEFQEEIDQKNFNWDLFTKKKNIKIKKLIEGRNEYLYRDDSGYIYHFFVVNDIIHGLQKL